MYIHKQAHLSNEHNYDCDECGLSTKTIKEMVVRKCHYSIT